MAQDTPRITTGTRWAYGGGGAGYGVLYNAHYFVLVYYSQVLGLDAGLAGLAVGIGLVFDAITDPLIGYLSDSTRSRWGRRHPWLYASILPLGASFYFLWHPPGFVAGNAPAESSSQVMAAQVRVRASTAAAARTAPGVSRSAP